MSNDKPWEDFSITPEESSAPWNDYDPIDEPAKDRGFTGALIDGAKSAGRAISSTYNTYTGDAQAVIDNAKTQELANEDKSQDIKNFQSDWAANTGAGTDGEVGLWGAIKGTGKAIIDNPRGAALSLAEQFPNSVPTLAGGWAGAKAGSIAGGTIGSAFAGVGAAPGAVIGAVTGFVGGMFLGNTLTETGYKAQEYAADGEFTLGEQSAAMTEGAKKAGVITAVDALTFGIGGKVSSTMRRTAESAVEAATRKTLIDAGVDISDTAALAAARSNPQIASQVVETQKNAARIADSLRKRAAEAGVLLTLETIGEGLGEYLGELAATGQASVSEAVLESFLSLGQSGVQTMFNLAKARDRSLTDQEWVDAANGIAPEGIAPEQLPVADGIWDEPAPKAKIDMGQMQDGGVTPLPVFNQQDIDRNLAPTPSQQMGINPDAGPLSAAAAQSVDSGLFTGGFTPQAGINQSALEREGVTPPPVLDADQIDRNLGSIDPLTGEYMPAPEQLGQPSQAGDAGNYEYDQWGNLSRVDGRTVEGYGQNQPRLGFNSKAERSTAPLYEVGPDGVARPSSGEAARSRKERIDLSSLKDRQQTNTQKQPAAMPEQRSPEQQAQSIWDSMNAFERNAAAANVLGMRGVPAKNTATKAWDKLSAEQQAKLVSGLDAQQGQRWTDPNQKVTDQTGPVLQNRDRTSQNSINQMRSISNNPDYSRLKTSGFLSDGAPVVVDENIQVPASQMGVTDTASAGNERFNVQYAVVEADQLMTSNSIDGTTNAEYQTGAAGKARAIAGNGRITGLQSAWAKGNASQYKADMAADRMHGIDPAVIEGMRNPILVRLLPQDQVTDNIGDLSNRDEKGRLSPVEQAKTDMGRIDLDSLKFTADGAIGGEAIHQFRMAQPTAERVTEAEARKRLTSAIFQKAYGNDQLTEIQSGESDDAKSILSALAQAAPSMSRLEGAGEFDIRPLITQAGIAAVNAARRGTKLADYVQQSEMGIDPMVYPILEMMLNENGNIRSSKYIGEQLTNMAKLAYDEANSPSSDMFGEKPKRTAEQVIQDALTGVQGYGQINDGRGQESLGQRGRSEPDAQMVEGPEGGRERPADTRQTAPTQPEAEQEQPAAVAPWGDRSFTLYVDEEYGPPPPHTKAYEAAKSAPKGSVTHGLTVRPSGKQWHNLYLSHGNGDFSSVSVGKDMPSNTAELIEQGFSDYDNKQKKQANALEEKNAISAKEIAIAKENNLALGRELGVIIPNTGKQFKSAKIVADHGDGTFTLRGVQGNKQAELRGLSASSIVRAMDRQNLQSGAKSEGSTPETWRSNYIQAARIARDKGIDPKRHKKLADLVAAIDASNTKPEAQTQLPAQQKQASGSVDGVKVHLNNSIDLTSALAAIARGAQLSTEPNGDVILSGAKIITFPKPPTSIDEVIAPLATALLEQMRADGVSMPGNPADMTRDQFAIAYHFANIIPEFEISGADIGGVVQGSSRGLTVDSDKLYDKIIEQAKEQAKPALELNQQTEESLAKDAERLERLQKEEATQKAKQKAAESKARERDADKARADEVLDDFQLGQQAEDAMSGMGDIFDAKQNEAKPASKSFQPAAELDGDQNADAPIPSGDWRTQVGGNDFRENKDGITVRKHDRTVHIRGATSIAANKKARELASQDIRELHHAASKEDQSDPFSEAAIWLDGDGNMIRKKGTKKPTGALASVLKQSAAKADNGKQAAPKTPAESIANAIDDVIKEQNAVIEDWKNRVYKNAKGSVDFEGDGPSTKGSMSINAINEGRRRKAIEQATNTINAARKLKDKVLREGSENLLSQAAVIFNTEIAGDKNPTSSKKDAMFEARFLRSIEFDGKQSGATQSNSISKAMLAAVKEHIKTKAIDKQKQIEAEAKLQKDFEADTRSTEELISDFFDDKTKQPTTKAPTEAIEDFGEKLEGARKDYASKLSDAKEVDIATEPLSKSWPEPNYQKLIDGGMPLETASIVRAIRDEIPVKPRASWRLKGWVRQVSEMRDLALNLMGETATAKVIVEQIKSNKSLSDIVNRADLYSAVGHDKSLKDISLKQSSYSLIDGVKYSPPKELWTVERPIKSSVISNMPRRIATAETREQAIAKFKNAYATLDESKRVKNKAVEFGVYTDRTTKDVFIGRKVGKSIARVKTGFKTAKDAIAHLKENYAALEERFNKMKDTPDHRKAENSPRVGVDHRNGADVTPEQFSDAFGFRGVQFGNYVEQGRRQQDLNEAYDALMDMAGVLGIPAKSLSLNGELGLAFGARGKGGKQAAKAHYEPDQIVINLTKKNGAGSLAHEWWHALDNYFGRERGGKSNEMYASDNRAHATVRPEMAKAYRDIASAVSRTKLKFRSDKLDRMRTKPYWGTGIEMTARSFESYVIEKLRDSELSNDYLANIVGEDYWNAAAALGIEKDGTYPYPEAAEIPEIRAAYDNFFNTLETKDGEDGNVLLFSFAGKTARGADLMALDQAQLRIASGDNAETVRQETGWHRGDDGKWRFEISDDQAKLRVAGKNAGELIDSAALDAITGGRKFPVTSDLIDHAQLFVAYPKLSNIKVEKMPEGGTALARLKRRATGFTIQLRDNLPREKVASAILHELQHGIQVYEGFAVGGSKNMVFSDLDMSGAKAYRALAGEVEARNTQTRHSMTPALRRNIAPELTQDTPSADVIVTFNGKDITNKAIPNNVNNAPITDASLVRAFDVQFPRLTKAVRTMLARGNKGERGGVVVIDSADPLMIARAFAKKTGKPISQSVQMFSDAGVINGFFDPKSGLTFLVGPNLNPVTGTAVLLHEMIHGQQRQKIDKAALAMLMNRGKEKNAETRAFLDRVAARMDDAGETANAQEAGAYIVEQAVMEGKSAGYGTADSRFLSWVDQHIGKTVGDFLRSFIGNLRSWALRNGLPIGPITVDDLVSYAMAGMKQAGRGNVDGGAAGFSRDATASLEDALAKLDALGLQHRISERNDVITVSKIEVPEGARGQGAGSSAMQALIDYADATGKHIALTPTADFGGNKARLKEFYQRFGFKENKGKNKVYEVSEGMVRENPNGRTLYSKGITEDLAEGQRQFAQTENAYGGRAAYDQAKSEGKTKLNYQQWVQVRTPAFKNWFGDWENESERVERKTERVQEVAGRNTAKPNARATQPAGRAWRLDPETGEPRIFYHGTKDSFTVFDLDHQNRKDHGWLGTGIYTGSDKLLAESYARLKDGSGEPRVMEFFANVRNPYKATIEDKQRGRFADRAYADRVTEKLKEAGYDGVVLPFADGSVELVAFDKPQIKSATGNVGTFSADNDDIRFSFAGQRSGTADHYSLGSAQQRIESGENAEAVRQDTGWHKGIDGKWRYEISDHDAKLRKPFPSKGQLWGGVYESVNQSKVQRGEGYGISLGEILDHPALFAAYPHLASLSVSTQKGSGASYESGSPSSPASISIGTDVPMYDVPSKLLHEIQHGIQNIEGFARGGTLETGAGLSNLHALLEKQKNEFENEHGFNDWIFELILEQPKRHKALMDEGAKDGYSLRSLYQSFASEKLSEEDRGYFVSRMLGYEDKLRKVALSKHITPSEFYQRLAGEVEARNTQIRHKMTAEQRKSTPPSATQDVSDADAIVMFNGTEMHNAPAPANTGTSDIRYSRAQTKTAAFKKQFGDSKVVDASGDPLLVYHGSGAKFATFDKNKRGATTRAKSAEEGFFFTSSKSLAYDFKKQAEGAAADLDAIRSAVEGLSDSQLESLASDIGRIASEDLDLEGREFFIDSLMDMYQYDTDINTWPEESNGTPKVLKKYIPKDILEPGAVHDVYLRIENPHEHIFSVDDDWHDEGAITRAISIAKKNGNDGVILRDMVDVARADEKGNNAIRSDVYIAFEPDQIIQSEDSAGIRFSRSANPASISAAPNGMAAWDSPSASKFDDFVYKMQDKHVDTKRVVEAIRDTGKAISDDLDVYLQETLFHGRAAKRTQDFLNKEVTPLIEYMQSAKVEMSDLEEFLHARHAQEANALIAKRDPNMPDGGSGMTNAEAAKYLKSLNGVRRKQLENAAKFVDKIIGGTRETIVNYGLESQETVDGWTAGFKHYIPLQREDKDGQMGIGQGFSVKGKETKGRTGSTRKVVDILANVMMQRERAIVRGEKNRVAVALLGLAKDNPLPEFWQVDKVPTTRVLDKVTGLVRNQADPMYKSRDNAIVAKVNGQEHAILMNEDDPRAMRMAEALKNLDAAQLEGLLGATATATRYFAAVNTQYNPIFGVTNFVRDIQEAMLHLQSTPLAGQQARLFKNTFTAVGAVMKAERDGRKGNNATGKWGVLWEDFQNIGGQTGFRDQFSNSADRGKEIQRALTPDGWAETGLGKFFTANGALKAPLEVVRKKAAWLFDLLSDYNTAMENGVRLSAYETGINAGMSKEQAAALAKGLTVNFNRKGQVTQQVGALYAFFNASVQGTARLGQSLFDMDAGKPKTLRLSSLGKKIVSGGVMLGASQAVLLAMAGFDDEEPPEFIRERNIIIPTGGKTYISIPMPLGYHVIANLGRIPMEFVLGGGKDGAKYLFNLMDVMADIYNPIGNSGLSMQTIAPTVLDPLAGLAENKDFSGRAIAKESFNRQTPGHALARDTASLPATWLAELVNYATGGTEFTRGELSPTPDQIDYLVGQLTGGVGRETTKFMKSIQATATGDDLPWHNIPLAGRFFGDADSDGAKQSAFYNNMDKVRKHAEEVKGLRAAGRISEAIEYANKHPQAKLHLAARAAEKQVKDMRDRKRDLEQAGAPREEIRALEKRMVQRMEQFVELAKAQ